MMYEIDTLLINISYHKSYQNPDQLLLSKVEVIDTFQIEEKYYPIRRRRIYDGWEFVSMYQEIMSNLETDSWKARLEIIGRHKIVNFYEYNTDDHNNWLERKTLFNDKVIRIETREIEYF